MRSGLLTAETKMTFRYVISLCSSSPPAFLAVRFPSIPPLSFPPSFCGFAFPFPFHSFLPFCVLSCKILLLPPSLPPSLPRSRSARIFWLVQMSYEMWDYAPDGEGREGGREGREGRREGEEVLLL